MLYKIVEQFPNDLTSDIGGPHISLYQPTHRSFPENKQDPILFKNLLREIVISLEKENEADFIDSIMEPFYALEEDKEFWNNTLDGIAVLANQDKCIIYKLQIPIKEFAVVSNSFHIKPLIQAFQFVQSYQLLGLSHNNFSLYQGNRYGLSEIELDPDIKRTLEEVLGKQTTEPALSHGAFVGKGNPTIHHGKGDKKEEDDKDTEKYFRYVDHYVTDNYSKESKLPLILVSLKEYHSQFKNLSKNDYLIEEGIDYSYDSLENDELIGKVSEIIESLNAKKIKTIIEDYNQAAGESMGSSDLAQVTKAAFEGKVKTVLIEENRIISGNVDYNTGKIESGDIDNPEFGDVLNSLAGLVLNKGGDVKIVLKNMMPVTTGVAAIYRYN